MAKKTDEELTALIVGVLNNDSDSSESNSSEDIDQDESNPSTDENNSQDDSHKDENENDDDQEVVDESDDDSDEDESDLEDKGLEALRAERKARKSAEKQVKTLTAQLQSAKDELKSYKIEALRLEKASKADLPEEAFELITGDTADQIDASITKIKKLVGTSKSSRRTPRRDDSLGSKSAMDSGTPSAAKAFEGFLSEALGS